MCFCATGSFAMSGGLAAAGAVTLAMAQSEEWMIAIIPLIFAVQQAIEGLQWLAPHPSEVSLGLGYGFLLFAFLLWPAYIPIAVYRVEKDRGRRRILRCFIGLGSLISLALLVTLLREPLHVQMYPRGIAYVIKIPFYMLGAAPYVFATCGSLLLSSRSVLRWFGVAGLVSAILTATIFEQAFTSVWCFFAAGLSVLIFFAMKKRPKYN